MGLQTAQQYRLTPDVLGAMQKGQQMRVADEAAANKSKVAEAAQRQLETRQRALGVPSQVPDNESSAQAEARMIADDPAKAKQFLEAKGMVGVNTSEELSRRMRYFASIPDIDVRNQAIQDDAERIEAKGGSAEETRMLLGFDNEKQINSIRGMEKIALTASEYDKSQAKDIDQSQEAEKIKIRRDEAKLSSLQKKIDTTKNENERKKLKMQVDKMDRDANTDYLEKGEKTVNALRQMDKVINESFESPEAFSAAGWTESRIAQLNEGIKSLGEVYGVNTSIIDEVLNSSQNIAVKTSNQKAMVKSIVRDYMLARGETSKSISDKDVESYTEQLSGAMGNPQALAEVMTNQRNKLVDEFALYQKTREEAGWSFPSIATFGEIKTRTNPYKEQPEILTLKVDGGTLTFKSQADLEAYKEEQGI